MSEVTDAYKISSVQLGMLFNSLKKTSDEYIVQQIFYTDHLDFDLLETACDILTSHIATLRTGFSEKGIDGAVQYVLAKVELNFEKYDFSDGDFEEKFKELLAADRVTPFDLAHPPLFRFKVVKRSNRESVIIFTFHHILLDGWSSGIVMSCLLAIYDSLLKEELPDQLDVPNFKYYISHVNSINFGRMKDFWRDYLKSTEIALLFPKKMNDSNEQVENMISFSPVFTERLQKFCMTYEITLNVLLLGALGIMLKTYSGNRNSIVGVVTSGRNINLPKIENMVGMLIRTIPMKLELKNDFIDYLKAVQNDFWGICENELFPLNEIQTIAGWQLFDVLYAFENYPVRTSTKVKSSESIERTEYPLTIVAYLEKDELKIIFRHKQCYLSNGTADSLRKIFERVLLNLQDYTEKFCFSENVIEDQFWEIENLTIPEKFTNAMRGLEDKIAVSIGSRQITYGMLDEISDNIAVYLINQGVKLDDIVALCSERSLDMICGILGILKSGAAYMPIDPACPEDRTNYMLQDSGVKICLCVDNVLPSFFCHKPETWHKMSLHERYFSQYKPELKDGMNIFVQHKFADTTVQFAQRNNEVEVTFPRVGNRRNTDNLAYVIYTSGSTGKPKGVLITHKNVINLFAAADQKFDFSSDDIWTMFHNFSFDFSVWECLGALLHGARLIVVPEEQTRDNAGFEKLISRNRVTVLSQTPEFLYNLHPCDLRYLVTGGAKLDFSKISDWLSRCKLINMYGITETTVHVTYYDVEEVEQISKVGRPLPNYQVHILDENLNPLPRGMKGEICVSGLGVARGYLGKPELTAERFIANPFGSGDRLYRSGDTGRYLSDGNIEYVGRIDNQVKVRGYRIELSEIENTINDCEGVRACAVLVKDQSIVAYVVTDLDSASIVNKISKYLPRYMLPNHFVLLDKLPLTDNGKINTKSLLAIDTGCYNRYVAPRNEVERRLCNVWEDVLNVLKVGIDDNFFQLGGDSIKIIRCVVEFNKIAGNHHITVSDILNNQNIRSLVENMQGDFSSSHSRDEKYEKFSLLNGINFEEKD